MTVAILPHEAVWLRELKRRAVEGLPVIRSEMMVQLRNELPRGFDPSQINHRFTYNRNISAEGLLAINRESILLPEIEGAIRHIRDRLIGNPSLAQLTAAEISDALSIGVERAQKVLDIVASLAGFCSGGAESPLGLTAISFRRDDVLAAYLGFESVEAQVEKSRPPKQGDSTPSDRGNGSATKLTGAVPHVPDTVFIMTSMDPQDRGLVDVHQAIRDVCMSFGLKASRIDDIEDHDVITAEILNQIRTAEFIVADLTGERPNVYYEVGYAHAVGKRPILARKTGTRLHFDLAVHNVREYENITTLRDILRRRFDAMLGRSPNGTPMT